MRLYASYHGFDAQGWPLTAAVVQPGSSNTVDGTAHMRKHRRAMLHNEFGINRARV
jgi:hypothetical protein